MKPHVLPQIYTSHLCTVFRPYQPASPAEFLTKAHRPQRQATCCLSVLSHCPAWSHRPSNFTFFLHW